MSELSFLAIFAIVVLITVFISLLMGIKMVPQGMEYTVERFGKYHTTLKPGFNVISPYIDMIGHKISMMEEVMSIPAQEVITKDNAMVKVDGVVFYQVMDAAKAAYQIKNLSSAVLNLTTTNIRSVMGAMDLDELLSKRDEISHRLLRVIDDATTSWGIKVLRVEIKDIAPPKDLVEAMAGQMKAEREKRALILEAEGERQSKILKAEGDKQATILAAEGRKDAVFLEAEARERMAQAEAKAVQMLSQAILNGEIHALNYFIAQHYVEALQKMATADNQRLVFMPLEAASVIGALGGIGELVKESFNPSAPSINREKT